MNSSNTTSSKNNIKQDGRSGNDKEKDGKIDRKIDVKKVVKKQEEQTSEKKDDKKRNIDGKLSIYLPPPISILGSLCHSNQSLLCSY